MIEYIFEKINPQYDVWEVTKIENGELHPRIGEHLYSFDKKKIYNFFSDFPHELSKEQIELFKKANPTMASLKIM